MANDIALLELPERPQPSPVPRPAKPEKYQYVDALRGIAVLFVVFGHASATVEGAYGASFTIGGFVARGAQLFYMISGMTLFLSLAARSRVEARPYVNFFIRRFFRIAPLFYLALVLRLVLPDAIPPDGNHVRTWFDTLMGAVFLNAWMPNAINAVVYGGWSVAIEMNFYLLLPYLFSKIRNATQALALVGGSYLAGRLVSEFAYRYFAGSADAPERVVLDMYFHVFWLPVELHVFAAGILLYFVVEELKKREDLSAPTRRTIGNLLIVASVPILLSSRNDLTVGVLAFCLLIPGLHLYENRWVVNPVTCFYGRISYGVYVSHFFMLQIVARFLEHAGLRRLGPDILMNYAKIAICMLLVLALSTPVAYLLSITLEKYGIRYGRDLIRRLEARARGLPA